jgi:hypothetical protein
MKLIDAISEDANQNMVVSIDGGGKAVVDLAFKSSQQGWFMSVTFGSFAIKNRRIVTGPNILRAFRNIIPFGFACITDDGNEPVTLDSFSTGKAKFYIL